MKFNKTDLVQRAREEFEKILNAMRTEVLQTWADGDYKPLEDPFVKHYLGIRDARTAAQRAGTYA